MANDYRSSVLMRRMAWRNCHNLDYREPSGDSDRRLNLFAVRMLTCISCLNYAMLDFEEELREEERFRHNVKRVFNLCNANVVNAHESAYRMLHRVNEVSSKQYNDNTDYFWCKIGEMVTLGGLEGSYNVVISLSRLIEKYNTMLLGRYDFAPAVRLYNFSSKFDFLGIKDYHLDFIIENALSK